MVFKFFISFLVFGGSFCCKEKLWTTWNSANHVRYGFINLTKTKLGAAQFCKSAHFQNLITVRNRTELNNLELAIESYENATGKIVSSVTENYWLGLVEVKSKSSSRNSMWKHYDNKEAHFTPWLASFPKRFPAPTCVVIRRECLKFCSLKWLNRPCNERFDISGIICESREKRIFMNEITQNIKAKIKHSKQFSASETDSLTGEILQSSTQSNFNISIVANGIRNLAILAAQNNTEVSVKSARKSLAVIQMYMNLAAKSMSDILATSTVEVGEIAVRALEQFLNRLEISENQTATFNTTSITAEVRHLKTGLNQNQKFSTPGRKGISIVISKEAIEMAGTGFGNKSRLLFINYRNSKLFPSSYKVFQVVSAQINGQVISGLKNPVLYSIPLGLINNSKAAFGQCASWNFSTSSWTKQGCWLASSRDSQTTCACNHMTNFALLVELIQRPAYFLFDVINRYIGIISCIGFFLVVVIYITFAKLRTSKTGPVHINLCFCYCFGYLIFLIGSENRDDEMSCLLVAILTHYFFLAGWCWTFVEAFTMYKLLVKKLNYLGFRYHLCAFFISYIFPFLVVAANVGLTVGYFDKLPIDGFYRISKSSLIFNSTYVSNFSCWLTSYSLYFGFLVVGGIIFSMNIVVYITVLRAITWERKKIRISSTRKHSSPKETFYRAVTIGILLGLVWLLAVPMELLAATKILVEPITYLFSLLIAAQGIVIFYLFCVRHVKARRLWWDPMWNGLRRHFCCINFGKKHRQIRHSLIFGSSRTYDVRLKEKNYYQKKQDSCITGITASGNYPSKNLDLSRFPKRRFNADFDKGSTKIFY